MTYRRKKCNRGYTSQGKLVKTKNRIKDLDEVDADIKNQAEELLSSKVDVELPGDGKFYCIHCVRYFVDKKALVDHYRTKVHKRRLKELELEPYTIEESEKAAGLGGNFSLPKKRKIETLPPKAFLVDQEEDLAAEAKKRKNP